MRFACEVALLSDTLVITTFTDLSNNSCCSVFLSNNYVPVRLNHCPLIQCAECSCDSVVSALTVVTLVSSALVLSVVTAFTAVLTFCEIL
jgi:hypothetical protein